MIVFIYFVKKQVHFIANVKCYVTNNGGTYIYWAQSLSCFGIIGKEIGFNGGGGNDYVLVCDFFKPAYY